MKTKNATADAAHKAYDEIVDALFTKLGRGRGGPARALALLCYQAYASAYFNYRPFEKLHDAVCPWEADVCKAIGDLILVKQDQNPWTVEQIKEMFHD